MSLLWRNYRKYIYIESKRNLQFCAHAKSWEFLKWNYINCIKGFRSRNDYRSFSVSINSDMTHHHSRTRSKFMCSVASVLDRIIACTGCARPNKRTKISLKAVRWHLRRSITWICDFVRTRVKSQCRRILCGPIDEGASQIRADRIVCNIVSQRGQAY